MTLSPVPRHEITDKTGQTPPVWRTFFTQLFAAAKSWIDFPYFTQTASKTVANTTDETTLFAAGQGMLTFPLNYFQPGTRVRVEAEGIFSNTGTPTLNFKVILGSTTLMSSGAITTAAATNRQWNLTADFVCRANGPSGTVIGQGVLRLTTATTVFTSYGMTMTSTASVDTTDPQTVDLTVTWGAADPANTITCTNAEIEVS